MVIDEKTRSNAEEVALLGRIGSGDVAAFEVFYKLYHPRLSRFILRTTRRAECVEELIQETLLLIWEQPQRFNGMSRVSTWVFGIAWHKALKANSRHARRSDDVDVDELSDLLGDPLSNLAERSEAQDWLNRALESLSPDQRAVIELTFYQGLPYDEIAQILDCPENTVKTRMFNARRKLQAFASTEG